MERKEQALVEDMTHLRFLALFAPSAWRDADSGVELYLLPVVNNPDNDG